MLIDIKNANICQKEGIIVLNNVNFKVEEGEFIYIIGRVGSGKSTLLKTLYFDRDVYEADTAVVLNHSLVGLKKKYIPRLRRQMGIIFQDFKLLPDRNVFENVALALRIVGTPSSKINAAVFDALALVGISQKRFAMPYTLSGGEQQRVAIARAMVHNPYLLLADEPTGNLDPKNAEEVFKIFKEINARGTTVVMATHNPDFYLNSPFRRLVLDHGELLNRDLI
jgi:cell division transport system ATP-binding protein